MEKSEITARLRTFLETEFTNDGVELTDSTDLLGEYFIDSLGIVSTVLFLENSFQIEVRRKDINGNNFKSIETLSEFVAQSLGG